MPCIVSVPYGEERVLVYILRILGWRKGYAVYSERTIRRTKGASLYLGCSGGGERVMPCIVSIPYGEERVLVCTLGVFTRAKKG